MSDTYIWKIDDYAEALKRAKEKGYEYVVSSTGIDGMVYSPSNKKPYYRIPMTIAGDAFKENTTVNVVRNDQKAIPNILVLIHKDHVKNINFPEK